MTSNIVRHDPNMRRVVAATRVEDPSAGIRFATTVSETSGLADTYVIAHYDGDGASTLGLFLSQFLETSPLLIEIGTNASRAFKSVPDENLFRPPLDAQYPVRQAMDERLRRPSMPAIIEFGRTLYRDALSVAAQLQAPPYSASTHYCFVASENDHDLKIPRLACSAGIESVLVFGSPKLARESRPGVIKIPTLSDDMQRLIYGEGLSMLGAAAASADRFSLLAFLAEFKVFGGTVQWELDK